MSLLAFPAASEVVHGPARVIDGDTLAIGAVRLRLLGIDAPEAAQTCTDAAGQAWACGVVATERLGALVATGETRCEGDERDRYGRLVAHCHAGGQDLNATLVREGLAEAYRKYSCDFVADEDAAKAVGRGIWGGPHLSPEAARRVVSNSEVAPDNCMIKGNISKNGRIFHTAHSRDYARTRIDVSKGERWFCSEAEALAAGWRPVGGI